MYLCDDCGATFEEPKVIEITHGGPYEAYGHESMVVCPECGCDSIGEVVICSECEKAIPKYNYADYVHINTCVKSTKRYLDDIVCNECLHDYCDYYFT